MVKWNEVHALMRSPKEEWLRHRSGKFNHSLHVLACLLFPPCLSPGINKGVGGRCHAVTWHPLFTLPELRKEFDVTAVNRRISISGLRRPCQPELGITLVMLLFAKHPTTRAIVFMHSKMSIVKIYQI